MKSILERVRWTLLVALGNPLLDFNRLLLVKRRLAPGGHGYSGDPFGLPCNWQSNSSIRNDVWDNEIAALHPIGGDGRLTTVYRPNPWGLHDMHGNVSEWTRSAFEAYPYRDDDGRNDMTRLDKRRVVRGGSWRDRPARAGSGFRLAYRPYQAVYNVGFRVISPVNQ